MSPRAWQLKIEQSKAATALRSVLVAIDEVLTLAALLAGVAVSQLLDPFGNRTEATGIDWLRAGLGFAIAAPLVLAAEQGDRAGKTKSLLKLVVRYSQTFAVGFTGSTVASAA